MKKIAIIGGETHIGEVTNLKGKLLDIAAACVRPDQAQWAEKTFQCPVVTDLAELLRRDDIDMVSVANENDLKGPTLLAALKKGWDVIVDKPLALTADEQNEIESILQRRKERRLLMLLTLRGNPVWSALHDLVHSGKIGTPAFTHLRMAVRLKRSERPKWFLDVRRSGGLFLDLLIHGLDYVEWLTGRHITAVTATMGNLGNTDDANLRDHAAVFCEFDDGSCAAVEGQRMLPDTKGSDYRVTIAGTKGFADLSLEDNKLVFTNSEGAGQELTPLPPAVSVVEDWLTGGNLVDQASSLRANRLAIAATQSALERRRIFV